MIQPFRIFGHVLPVAVVAGVPRCPDCHEPMRLAEPGVWECEVTTALRERLSSELRVAFDRAIG